MQDTEWKQFYPTFKIQKRGILFEEYRASIESIKSSEQSFSFFANLAIILVTAAGSVIFSQTKEGGYFTLLTENVYLSFLLLVFVYIFIIITSSYIGNRIKSFLYEERKVVILRVILGLDYGSQHLVLPIDRVEGAVNPFEIKFFPSFFYPHFYPFWVFLIFFAAISLLLLNIISVAATLYPENSNFMFIPNNLKLIYFTLIFSIVLVFRKSLFDVHENFRLIFSNLLAKIVFLKIYSNIGYKLYRARLARFESQRLKFNLEIFYDILIFIEDRRFFQHGGFDVRAIIRAIHQYCKRGKRSGASTITQQVARTIFIEDYFKTYRRKIIEISLAFWLESIMPKHEILDIYLSSVRFSKGVYGVSNALTHFFPDTHPSAVGKEHAFILIERVANIHDTLKIDRIEALLEASVRSNVLNTSDVNKIKHMYYCLTISTKLFAPEFERISNWNMSTQ